MALHIVTHPLVQHKLSLMRNKGTGVKEFRELTEETAMLICYEAMRDLQDRKAGNPTGLVGNQDHFW